MKKNNAALLVKVVGINKLLFQMEQSKRQQLTLFLRPEDAHIIESIREKYNPVQKRLIAAHVTLCREDEIENQEIILNNLRQLNTQPITIMFGAVTRFNDGKGLLIPAMGNNAAFDQLRRQILTGTQINIRKHGPHITLMHPRNSTCTDEIFKQIRKIHLPKSLLFDTISLIEQEDGGVWQVLKIFKLI